MKNNNDINNTLFCLLRNSKIFSLLMQEKKYSDDEEEAKGQANRIKER